MHIALPFNGQGAASARSRFGTAYAMAGVLFAGFVNVLWIAGLGYAVSLLIF
jgi:hypothetical protein